MINIALAEEVCPTIVPPLKVFLHARDNIFFVDGDEVVPIRSHVLVNESQRMEQLMGDCHEAVPARDECAALFKSHLFNLFTANPAPAYLATTFYLVLKKDIVTGGGSCLLKGDATRELPKDVTHCPPHSLLT